ncbi:hypothetical protein FGF1_03600 [Flavobacteriaceae bacterium GF1]
MKRKITIIMEGRSATDDPKLLEEIGRSFPEDDIKIQIKPNQMVDDEVGRIQCDDVAQEALDESEEEHWDVDLGEGEGEMAEKELREFRKELGKHGVKMTVGTIIQELIKSIFG